MRKLTDPGIAPPAPGSVSPARPPRPTPPGAYAEDEIPTRPDGALQPELLKLVQLVDNLAPVERRRFLKMVEHYGKLGLGRRVLVEELTRELACG